MRTWRLMLAPWFLRIIIRFRYMDYRNNDFWKFLFFVYLYRQFAYVNSSEMRSHLVKPKLLYYSTASWLKFLSIRSSPHCSFFRLIKINKSFTKYTLDFFSRGMNWKTWKKSQFKLRKKKKEKIPSFIKKSSVRQTLGQKKCLPSPI